MKKIMSYLLAGTILAIVFYGTYRANVWLKTPASQNPIPAPQKQTILPENTHPAISDSLSDDALQDGEKIAPTDIKTTYQLAEAFHTIYRRHIRPVYIDAFPSDFSQKGGPELFIKVIMALVLRENNAIKQDRRFLMDLQRLHQQNMPWDEIQTARFNNLINAYGITEQKMIDSQLTELLKRVDIIPPSLAVAMAGVHTNWGKTALKSPFGQKEWIDGKYTEKQFDTLTEAVKAYMMELNTLPIYYPMRVNRDTYRNLRGSLGEQLITTVNDFMPENPNYVRQLEQAFKDKRLAELDNAILFE